MRCWLMTGGTGTAPLGRGCAPVLGGGDGAGAPRRVYTRSKGCTGGRGCTIRRGGESAGPAGAAAGVTGLRGANPGGTVGAARGSAGVDAPGAARGSAGVDAPGAAHGSAGEGAPVADVGTGPAGDAMGEPADRGFCDGPIGAGTKSVASSRKSYAYGVGCGESSEKGNVDSSNTTCRDMMTRLDEVSRQRYPL